VAHARRVFELCAISAIALFWLLTTAPTFMLLGRPAGDFGLSWGARPDEAGALDLTAIAENPQSPAAKAGVVPGAHLPDHASLRDRLFVTGPALAGASRTFDLVRNGVEHDVKLTAAQGTVYHPDDLFDRIYFAIRLPSTLVFVLVAVVLIVRVPSKMTWGLALFVLNLGPVGVADRYFGPLLDPVGAAVLSSIFLVLSVFADVGVLVFALRFPSAEAQGVGRIIDRAAWPLASAVSIVAIAGRFLPLYFPETSPFVLGVDALVDATMVLPWVAAIVLLSTLVRAKGVERRRLQWVIAGVTIGCIALPVNLFVTYVGSIGPSYIPYSIGLAQVLAPIFIAYGVLRSRLLDIGFVLNRATVYAAVTALLIGTFGLVRLLLSTYVKSNLASMVQVLTAIGLGLSTQRIYKVADWLVDRYFFPSTLATENRLKRLGDGLRHVETTDSVAGAVTAEAAAALHLASSALFRKLGDGSFVRRASTGWGDGTFTQISASEMLPIYLNGDASHFSPSAVLEGRAGLPAGTAVPRHAYPLVVRAELIGFALYSDHEDGTALDPDEIGMLDKLVKSAADAYDPLLRIKRVRDELARTIAQPE
jgi:hypothetical protein